MKLRYGFIVAAALVPMVWIAACNDDNKSATEPVVPAGVEALRGTMAPFASFQLAKDAGYSTMLTDCMSNGDEGAMGIHYAKPALIDAVADSLHPEALIYEPGTDGQMSLVGVEFIVPFTAVARTATAPTLFGQKFQINDVFGVWALHVWTHRTNPSGTFANWNPRVHC